jgi:hypothetical protein
VVVTPFWRSILPPASPFGKTNLDRTLPLAFLKQNTVNLRPFFLKQFFNVLKRVKSIHQDCKLLLRTNQQTIGLEIMEQMALHQESAYERLYRWLQSKIFSFLCFQLFFSLVLKR